MIEISPQPNPGLGQHQNRCPPECARAGIETTFIFDYSRSIVGVGCLAGIIFGAEAGRTYGSNHGQELLERHLEIEEAALAKKPSRSNPESRQGS